MREIFDNILHRIESHATASYFVNGAPGVGKSYMLKEFERRLPDEISGCVVLPPYELTTIEGFCTWLITQCEKNHLIDDMPDNAYVRQNLDVLWQWLSEKVGLMKNQTLVLLVDIGAVHDQPNDSIATLFSVMSSLENHRWNFKLHHIVVGFWNHEALLQHFFKANLTFPYEVGSNYRLFTGVEVGMMATLLPESQYPELHSQLLYEITGGHLGAASAIAQSFKETSLQSMLNAVHHIAKQHQVTERLLSVWKKLPTAALELLEGLLRQRHLHVSVNSNGEHLLSAGIAQRTVVNRQVYLRFQSWYVELALRYHADELALNDKRLSQVDVANLAPVLTSLNDKAYRLIRDIEISTRNFVSIRLSLNNKSDDSILKGVNRRIDSSNLLTDADERTRHERKRIQSYGLNADLNPQIAYMTTGDLAGVLEEIGRKHDDKAWLKISKSVQQMASIRNAVMHNQLVDESALTTLYDLRAAIYTALNR
ncbi:MAG: hypothetical protein Q9P44_19315 [Anaerolineae bacterium]|nr:hypothetical protein [Anaerolineae bacterium]